MAADAEADVAEAAEVQEHEAAETREDDAPLVEALAGMNVTN